MARAPHFAAIASDLEDFIRERFDVSPDDAAFHGETQLYRRGYLDSTAAVEVFAYLEERHQVELPDDLLFGADFTTIFGMARSVAMLLGR